MLSECLLVLFKLFIVNTFNKMIFSIILVPKESSTMKSRYFVKMQSSVALIERAHILSICVSDCVEFYQP